MPVATVRICCNGIPARTLTDFELANLKSNEGLIDLPFSLLRSLILELQQDETLGVAHGYDRDYVLYVTFQAELYCYQTLASDRKQRALQCACAEYHTSTDCISHLRVEYYRAS
eukprot:SAG31_NODE_10273_length_1162_cov_0.967074_2_plen_113_part_01